MDAPKSSTLPLRLRYQAHQGTREIFRTAKHGPNDFDSIHASAAYMAVGYGRENLTPDFIGSRTQKANDYTPEPGLNSIKIALEHALETIHCTLQDEPVGFYVRIGIYGDNIKGLQLVRKAAGSEGLGYYLTWSGKPKYYSALLEETFTVHQKIEYLVGRDRVKIDYRFPGGNTRPYFDQKIVVAKCKEILDQMQEDYYASRRWNQISRFVLPYDCHGWLKGYCHHGPEKCLYRRRMKMLATGITPHEQSKIDEAQMRKIPTCKYWAQGKCFNGDACNFAHEGAGGALARPVCIYWQQGECFNGDACGFRHEKIMTDVEPECATVDLCVERGGMSVGFHVIEGGNLEGRVPRGPLYMYTKRGKCAGAGDHVRANHSIQHYVLAWKPLKSVETIGRSAYIIVAKMVASDRFNVSDVIRWHSVSKGSWMVCEQFEPTNKWKTDRKRYVPVVR